MGFITHLENVRTVHDTVTLGVGCYRGEWGVIGELGVVGELVVIGVLLRELLRELLSI